VSSGSINTAAIKTDGTLWTWGEQSCGVLGNGVTGAFGSAMSTPVTTFAGGTNWKQVSVSIAPSLLISLGDGSITFPSQIASIKTDGTLWTWGINISGQLGNGNNLIQRIVTPVTTFSGGTNWKQISVGFDHMISVKTDGTLWTWGSGSYGQLGNGITTGSRSTPITTFAGGTNWKQVSAGGLHTAAIKTDGTLWIWGYVVNGALGNAVVTITTGNRSTPITTFAGGNNWKQVSVGNNFTAAIKTDGTLWTWGLGSDGRLGNGVATGNIDTPVTTFAGGTNWKQVSCGNAHTAAIKTDGTLWIWGTGSRGALGINTTIPNVSMSTPVTTFAGGTNWKQVHCSLDTTAAIKTDGTLWTWGYNSGGKLGTNDVTFRSTPVTTFAGGTNWKQVVSGDFYLAAVQAGINAEYPLS
jgi:alpha-tubulin suppressor-like RCC1 family protein